MTLPGHSRFLAQSDTIPSNNSPNLNESENLRSGNPIRSVAFSPTWGLVVSGSDDHSVCLWDLHLNECSWISRNGHLDRVNSVVFSPNGTRIASASRDKTVLLWGLSTNTPFAGPFLGHSASVNSIAFSPNGSRIASGSSDCTIRVCDAHDGSLILSPLEGHSDSVQSVAFSSDGTRIVSGSSDGTIRIWNMNDGSLALRPLEGHIGAVQSVAFSPVNDLIVSGSDDCTTRVWSVFNGPRRFVIQTFEGHAGTVQSVAFSSNGTRIVSSSSDHAIRVWSVTNMLFASPPLKGHTGIVHSVAFSPDRDHVVASGSSDGTIRIWNTMTAGSVLVLEPPNQDSRLCSDTRASDKINAGELLAPDGGSTTTVGPPNVPSAHVQVATSILTDSDPDHTTSSPESTINTISSQMSDGEVFQHLLQHGCNDMSSHMDLNQYSSLPIVCGGFGDIWKGKLLDGTEVAVKAWRLGTSSQRNPKMLKRAAREIYNWSKLKHENIQELMGVVILHGRPAMVSRWQEHGNLRDYVNNYSSADRYSLCIQVATGVSYLHNSNFVHGDLKAANILVSQDNIAKLSDFDHSIMLDCSLAFTETTNQRGGTTRWMAPELIFDDKSHRNEQTDVYALGMTMLEIFTGSSPYSQCREDPQVIGALMNKKLPHRSTDHWSENNRDTQMWELLIACWDHEPSRRPKAFEVLESVKWILRL